MHNDNLPVEVSQATALAQASYEVALSVHIDSPAMLAIAGDELRAVTAKRKQMEELRLSLTRPLDESKRRIMDLFRAPTERLDQAEQLLRKGVLTYQQAERERVEAERRAIEAKAAAERAEAERARRQADADARAAQELAQTASSEAERTEAEKMGLAAQELAQEAQARIELADVAPLPMVAAATKADGISTRTDWKADVTDLKALVLAAAERCAHGDDTLLAFIMADTKALAGAARSMRGKLCVPGVRVYTVDSLTVRSA